jgi:hypothetical protein
MSATYATRVSTLSKVLDDQNGLLGYTAATTLQQVGAHKDLRGALGVLAAQHGVDADWREFKGLHEEAQRRRGKPEAQLGTNVHGVMEAIQAGTDVEAFADPGDVADARAALAILDSEDLEPVGSEEFVVVEGLRELVAGTRDILARHRVTERFHVVDLKTSGKPGDESYKALGWATQLALYSRGRPYLEPVERDRWGRPRIDLSLVCEEGRDIDTERGLVVEVIRGTGQAVPHWLDLTIGWAAADLATRVRTARKTPVLLEDPDG